MIEAADFFFAVNWCGYQGELTRLYYRHIIQVPKCCVWRIGCWILDVEYFFMVVFPISIEKMGVECSAPNLLTDLLRLGSKGINHGDDAVQGCAPPVMFVGL